MYAEEKRENYYFALDLLGGDERLRKEKTSRITTPYVISTSIVSALCHVAAEKFGDRFENGFMRKDVKLTEFLLYWAFVRVIHDGNHFPYARGTFDNITLWQADLAYVEKALTAVSLKDNFNVLSLHKNFVNHADVDAVSKVCRFLSDRAIAQNAEDIVSDLHRMRPEG